jgi:hypothetical protein
MKHDELRSIGHNIADSLASGVGLLVGICATDVFGEARKSPEGFITVDFMKGITTGGPASASLVKAVGLYRDALPDLCERHGASVSSFRELTARYSVDTAGGRVLVTVEDKNGRRSTDEYIGSPLRYVKTVDNLGRIRTKRS